MAKNPVFNSKNFKSQLQTQPPAGYGTTQQGYGQPMSPEQLQDMYNAPAATAAQTGRVTYSDVINKTLISLALVLAGAVLGWNVTGLLLIGIVAGVVLGLVNSFKKKPSPPLILAYSFSQGVVLGAISGILEYYYPGIAIQAVVATLSVFAGVLALFKSGKIRTSPKLTKIFYAAMLGYLLFSLVNFGLVLFGATDSMFGLRSGWLGLAIGLFAVALASYSLVMDFEDIARAVNTGAPKIVAWIGAFGLTVTLVWLYIEIIRIIAILRGSD
ncbi:Bax inhibitor-1/YccA family protein [Micrococcoides hystricis]|uniref:Bax inhibitor-1/YccA family protein n=1 Tax=Micrococcoides hystricis TaxID=1572761 RepID=A0ABV6PA54_9MICC